MALGDDGMFQEDGYKWSQEASTVTVVVPIPQDAGSSAIEYSLKPSKLSVSVQGEPVFADVDLYSTVRVDDCLWEIEERDGGKCVLITLQKATGRGWRHLLASRAGPTPVSRWADMQDGAPDPGPDRHPSAGPKVLYHSTKE
eukprot:TRINITY_DN16126_c0_g1_i1.p2 TRINITY_DN16126_c0_g1~~TRINITY_DN16126_c0_g1_i1.p2  ORF type:complete len:142 (+),score=27.98 TRINITY_DN16126_c0_g1_i1:66-491(+)